MKGTIISCWREVVKSQFGGETWKRVLAEAGLPIMKHHLPVEDVDDSEATAIIRGTCRVLSLSLEEASDAFGEYWMTVYAPG
ncbi:heme NO-binding domain-containing protein, partial [Myxococcota bacterium]